MDLIVKGRNITVTPALRDYAKEKILKLTRFFEPMVKMEIEMIVQKNPSIQMNQTAEVTIFTKKAVIRAKESSTDMYSALDQVADKLERQIKRYKGKLYTSNNKHNKKPAEAAAKASKKEAKKGPAIVKTKQFAIKPMTPEEASLQMELLGHDFYVFTNSETEEINVIYRRRDNNYGLIEPQYKP